VSNSLSVGCVAISLIQRLVLNLTSLVLPLTGTDIGLAPYVLTAPWPCALDLASGFLSYALESLS
jgi:hypothetical protein